MCAKVKTKKAKIDFKSSVTSILESHLLYLEPEQLEPLLNDLLIFYNETFKPDDSTPFWSDLVSHWLNFYLEIVGEKCEFNAVEAINLKRISKTLRHRYLEAVPTGIWDLQTCIRQHELYYRSAITISFYRQALSLTNLYSKFNEIVAQLSARKKSQE